MFKLLKFSILPVLLMGLFLLISPPGVAAQEDVAGESAVVEVEQNLVEEIGQVLGVNSFIEGPHFRFGENITITEDLVGDVYVAGGNIRIDGNIDGDLMVAGGMVIINGDVSQDVRAAGGRVTVNGLIGGNMSLAAGTADFSQDSVIAQSLVAGMGVGNFEGQVDGDAILAVGSAQVGGVFHQNVQLEVEDAYLAPTAMIDGDAMVNVAEDGTYDNQGVIVGEEKVEYELPTGDSKPAQKWSKYGKVGMVAAWEKVSIGLTLMTTIMGLVAGAVLLWAFPKLSKKLAAYIQTDFVSSLGWGFAYLILTPFAVVLLMITVLGMPLAGLVMLTYLFNLVVAKYVAGYALGGWMKSKYKISWLKQEWTVFAFGFVVLKLLSLIPVLGGLVGLVALLTGIGAIFVWLKSLLNK